MRQFMMKVLFKHEWITFIWMGVFFVAFGVSSLNLFMLFKANFDLYLEHGAMVIDDGALWTMDFLVEGTIGTLPAAK